MGRVWRGSELMSVIAVITGTGSAASTALTVTCTPSTASGSGHVPLTTGSVTAAASGGSGSYSYEWIMLPGGTVVAGADTPLSATTTFTCELGAAGYRYANFRCTATDTVNPGSTGYINILVYFNITI